MLLLVIEENMGAERHQNWRLGPNSHKVGFVGGGAPSSKSMHDPSMGRCVSGRNDCYSNPAHTIVVHIDPS